MHPDAAASSQSASTAVPLVGVIMGSQSDWETMRHAAETLTHLGVSHECRVVSAHRTPDLLFEYASAAHGRGLRVIIAGAGGAAHLPGMCAAKTTLPVLGVPVESKALHGVDSLLSIVQMPGGVPTATFAIGKAGAINAALFAASVLGHTHPAIARAYELFRRGQTEQVLANPTPGAMDSATERHA
ncbi:MAG: 5-(carboxyamino)imidazole ribonucleotide mutase [Phycisphaerae bacterium]|nr:5-(carboxyamino)imidazole ribonucleotide mutase [Phycisphaerae bacterium]